MFGISCNPEISQQIFWVNEAEHDLIIAQWVLQVLYEYSVTLNPDKSVTKVNKKFKYVGPKIIYREYK